MAMVQAIRVRCLKLSTWLSCGVSPLSLAVRVCYTQDTFAQLPNKDSTNMVIDNKYGMGTSASRSSALTDYYKRGQYIPGLKVNGMDVLAVKAAVKYGKQWTVEDNGPLVLEYVTYRYGGHSMSDPGTTYRTREEIQRMRSTNDPIAGLKQKLLDWEVVTEDELKTLDKDARKYVNDEVAIAEAM